jgi:formylglycine-generating enzyme required for sulfatase activity
MAPRTHARSVGIERALYALALVVCLIFPLRESAATNIQITNLTVHPHSGGTGEVEFDLSWGNSWRALAVNEPYNWDAAWVFLKIRRNGGDWTHLYLDETGHTIPSSPIAITTALGRVDPTIAHNASTNPNVGIFLHRTNNGFGTFTANDMRLRWNYADNGASSGDVIEIRVLGIEMVYIPEGAFYAGDGSGSTTNAFRQGSSDNDPWYIGSVAEEGLTATNSAGSGTGVSREAAEYYDLLDITGYTLPAAFPKGYKAFYMMKGEISQGQYVTFFNMLTATQKSTRDITAGTYNSTGKASDAIVNRNNISCPPTAPTPCTGEATLNGGTHSGVAMNFMSWADLTALLDWSGLRPMSELEYEKAGRGSRGVSSPIAAVSGEYAWGSTSITRGTSISDSGLASERAHSGSNANIHGSPSLGGPLRVASFAKGVTTDMRVNSGGGFYGVMELSGNVWERAVTVGNSTGRAFEGRYHGNGVLDSSGNPNVTSWPGTNANGAGFRGGGWDSFANGARLSDRFSAASTSASRGPKIGGRGVRSAP